MAIGLVSAWWIDADEAMTGQRVTVVGRGLQGAAVLVGGISPVVVDQHECLISFEFPAGLTGPQAVTVGGVSLGNVEAKGALDDPFGIGLGWADEMDATAVEVINVKTDGRLALHCVGDGATNDAPAFREALALAQTLGAATVYFPAGTYRIDDGTMCQVAQGTALKGAGMDLTTIEVGYRFTAGNAPTPGYYALGFYGERLGMANLTVQNLNGHASENGVMRPVTANAKCFLLSCRFSLGNGKAVSLTELEDGVVRGCEFSSQSLASAPLTLTGSQRLRVEGNAFAYRAGRVNLAFGRRTVIRGNSLTIDSTYFTEGGSETGGLELSYGQEILTDSNTLAFEGPQNSRYGDGELINVQSSNIAFYRGTKAVASVDGTTVAVTGGLEETDWALANYPSYRKHALQVLTGPAAGEWRWIDSHDADGVTLESPFDSEPDPGDELNVNALAGCRQTIVRNELSRGMTAVTIWNGALQCDVVDNVCTNSGPILLRSDSRIDQLAGTGRLYFQPVWDCRVQGNSLTNTLGIRPACASLSIVRVDGTAHPLMVNGVRIVGNAVSGLGDASGPETIASFDGIELVQISEDGGPLAESYAQGIVLSGNVLTGGALVTGAVPFSLL